MGKLTRLYIIRHAEAEGNLYRRAHGQYDSKITENGRLQLEALSKRICREPVSVVYSSDLYRAKKTAEAFALPMGLDIRETKVLREINLGVWEDMPWGEIERLYNREFGIFNKKPHKFKISGGESCSKMTRRVYDGIYDIVNKNKGENIAAVFHGMAIRSVVNRLSGNKDEDILSIKHCDNTAVSIFDFDEYLRPKLVTIGDNSHLGGILSTIEKQNWWREEQDPSLAHKDANMWFTPGDTGRDAVYFDSYRRDAYELIYGSLKHYSAARAIYSAVRMLSDDRSSVVFAMLGEKRAGLLQMSVRDYEGPEYGHIAFIYLTPENRGRGLGAQLIGQAVSFYRARGKKALRLRVAAENNIAQRFYKKHGFVVMYKEDTPLGESYVMKKDI